LLAVSLETAHLLVRPHSNKLKIISLQLLASLVAILEKTCHVDNVEKALICDQLEETKIDENIANFLGQDLGCCRLRSVKQRQAWSDMSASKESKFSGMRGQPSTLLRT